MGRHSVRVVAQWRIRKVSGLIGWRVRRPCLVGRWCNVHGGGLLDAPKFNVDVDNTALEHQQQYGLSLLPSSSQYSERERH